MPGKARVFASPRNLLTMIGAHLLLAAPPVAAQEPCDCSCASYATMMRLTEEARTAADSGDFTMPAELQQLSICAGQCARQWARCATPEAADAVGPAGALAETQHVAPQPREDAGLLKDRLTPAYLEGVWCSVYGGREVTQWRFHADGSYEIGVPAGRGFTFGGIDPRSLEHFRNRFDALVELEPDAFTTRDGVERENVFTRGECN